MVIDGLKDIVGMWFDQNPHMIQEKSHQQIESFRKSELGQYFINDILALELLPIIIGIVSCERIIAKQSG